jgi:hypothetical protein
MPIKVDKTSPSDLAPRIDEALELVCNEFEGLDTHRQYRNAFARLLKSDPLQRVTMIQTSGICLRRSCVKRWSAMYQTGATFLIWVPGTARPLRW